MCFRVLNMYAILSLLLTAATVLGDTEVERVSRLAGIWSIHHTDVTTTECPAMKGKMAAIQWRDIEPSDDHWMWANLDDRMKGIADMGIPIGLVVYSGQTAPDWIYSSGVTHPVSTDQDGREGATGPYPYYLTDKYKMHYKRYVTKVREHIETLPSNIRQKLLFLQAGFGTTGDAIPWHGKPLNHTDDISSVQWDNYQHEMMLYFYNEFKHMKPHIYLLFNQGNTMKDMDDWLSQHCPGSWRKAGHAGHGYQMNGEAELKWLSQTLSSVQNNLPVAARSELSKNSYDAAYWKKAPAMNMFAQLASAADFGLDIENLHEHTLKDEAYWPAYEFFNRHAGSKRTNIAQSGFCAFRDGLDSADTHRFPENKYGPLYQSHHHGPTKRYLNGERMKNIAKAFSHRGAVLNDEHAAVGSAMANRAAKDFNDVGINIHPGNYERNLHQLDPDGTSIGWWRVGDIKIEMYGRFARGFEHSSGKNEMHFQFDRNLWGGLPLKSSLRINIIVAYFDQGHGHWEMHYDGSGHGGETLLFAIHKTNSGKWKTVSKVINNGHFGQRGPRNSDLWLKNTDNEDDVFGLIEAFKVDVHGSFVIG